MLPLFSTGDIYHQMLNIINQTLANFTAVSRTSQSGAGDTKKNHKVIMLPKHAKIFQELPRERIRKCSELLFVV